MNFGIPHTSLDLYCTGQINYYYKNKNRLDQNINGIGNCFSVLIVRLVVLTKVSVWNRLLTRTNQYSYRKPVVNNLNVQLIFHNHKYKRVLQRIARITTKILHMFLLYFLINVFVVFLCDQNGAPGPILYIFHRNCQTRSICSESGTKMIAKI